MITFSSDAPFAIGVGLDMREPDGALSSADMRRALNITYEICPKSEERN